MGATASLSNSNYTPNVAPIFIYEDVTAAQCSTYCNNNNCSAMRFVSSNPITITGPNSSTSYAQTLQEMEAANLQSCSIYNEPTISLIPYTGSGYSTMANLSVSCPSGKFITSNGLGCTNCPVGSYCSGLQNQPIQCPAGSYCPNGLGPLQCTAGQYCPAGSTSAGQCSEGNYCPDPTQQIQCPAGNYCLANSTTYTPCVIPSWCKAGSSFPPLSAPPCPAGSYCPDPTQQIQCPAGNYCSANSTTYTPCTAGQYCPAGSTSAGQCVSGNYCPDPTQQIPCPAGNYCLANSTTYTPCSNTLSTALELCPTGTNTQPKCTIM